MPALEGAEHDLAVDLVREMARPLQVSTKTKVAVT
jgi:hypothetical protein